MEKFVVLDIETENTGYDIMEHNKRIISVQLYDGSEGTLFYDGSNKNSISAAKSALLTQIDQNYKFVGFNIRNFDAHLLNKFLGVTIPRGQIVELSEMPNMERIRKQLTKNYPTLAEVCGHLGIDCSHKGIMDGLSAKIRNLPDVLEMAREGAEKMVKERGWSYDFSYNRALDKIAGGRAILQSFNEFVSSQGDSESLFYKYAMGDVFTEHRLFQNLRV